MLGYLSQTAFKLGHLNISKKAAEILLSKYIEKNETKYQMLNGERNPALLYKLKYSDINDVSVTTIRQIVEGFLLIAGISRLQKPKFDHAPANNDSPEVRQTKLKLRICNFLLMALELVIILKNPSLIKRTVGELFNFSLPFLSFDPKPLFIKNYLMYAHQAILKIPDEFMDGSMRKIGSCLGYEINKGESSDLYVRLMKTELAMELRKWQTYTQVVTKLDKLTEEEVAKQQEQKELLEKGEEVPEEEIIKDPEPYEVTETYCIEIEKESKAYEEFLLMFHDEFTTERVEKWKAKLHKLMPVLTNGEEVVNTINSEMDSTVEFWKMLKEDPESQINNEALKENPRFLEFTCKALQRVMEIGEKTDEEMNEIVSRVELDQENLKECEEYITSTKGNLANDTVQRRQNRFTLIEEKVKNIQQEKANEILERQENGEKFTDETVIDISMVELDKLFGAIRSELASGEQFQKPEYDEKHLSYFQNVSQYLFLQAMVLTMSERKKFEYRKDTGLPTYQNIQLLEFEDMKVQVKNFNEGVISERNRIRDQIIEDIENKKQEQEQNEEAKEGEGEEKIPELDEIEVPVDDRVKSISSIINLLSRSSQYCCNSKSWVLLENIVKYTWNLITYELVSPLELSQTDAYKDIFLMAESVLNLLSQAVLVGDSQTERLPEPEVTIPISTKTVKFADQNTTESAHKIKVTESELKFYSDFIAYTVQCLFVAEKWESMVDLTDTANKQLLAVCTELNDTMLFFSLYLYQFRIYGEDKLYTTASQHTDRVKEELAIRIAKFKQWKATSKKSKSRTALLTGEVPKEELQYRKDKAELENEIFRLEVHEHILESDKSQSQEERNKIKKSSNSLIEELRLSRKLYQKYGIESHQLKFEIKLPGERSKFSKNRKVEKSLATIAVSKYSKLIERIRKKKEKFLLIQSLHEIGNLYYSDDQLKNAEVQWNDCVDAIFQKDVFILKTYRPLFKEIPNLAATYGSIQCVIGGVVLAKLAKFIYNNNIHLQREAVLMGSELFNAPFKVSMFHPHNKIDFADYRMKEFLPECDLIGEKQVLLPSDLLTGLEIICEMLLDYGLYERILPCATMMNYVATDIVKSIPYMIKAKALKGIALSNLGYISESLNLFHQIVGNKDQVINVTNPSEFLKLTKGSSFKFTDPLKSYRNDLPPEAEENVQSLDHLIETEVELCDQFKISPLLESLVSYLKSSILLSVLHDPYDISDVEDLRAKYFTAAEEGFNSGLESVQNEESIVTYKTKVDFIEKLAEKNNRIQNYMRY